MPKLDTYAAATTVADLTDFIVMVPKTGGFDVKRVPKTVMATFIQGLGSSPGDDGREIQIQKSSTAIQWRYVGATTWIDLVLLADLVGANGKAVEMQANGTYVQWRYAGAADWTNLVALSLLKGDRGTGLTPRGTWAAGTFQPGDYVTANNALWFLIDAVAYNSTTTPSGDLSHWMRMDVPAGQNGLSAYELAVAAGYGDTLINWLASLQGTNGKNIQLQKGTTHIQWRVAGDTAWTDLVALADITGPAGSGGGTSAPVVLQFGSVVTINASLGETFVLTLAGHAQIANPTNLVDGKIIRLFVKQHPSGSLTLANWGSLWKWEGGVAPVMSTAANAIDCFEGQWIATLGIIAARQRKGFA